MSLPGSHIFYEYGYGSASDHRYVDEEGRPAFTVTRFQGERQSDPNTLVRLTREKEWAQQHPEVMGPSSAFYFCGYNDAPVHMAFGNGQRMPVGEWMKQKKEQSISRYYTGQNGKEYKWRIMGDFMECVQGRTVLAEWRRADKHEEHNARVILKHASLPVVTEIFATLTLNRLREEQHRSTSTLR